MEASKSGEAHWEALPTDVRKELIFNAVQTNYRHAQIAMLMLACLFTAMLLIVTATRDMSRANLIALSLLNTLFWLFPITLQYSTANRTYTLIKAWVGMMALALLAQSTYYLFGPEHHLILDNGWPPLAVAVIPLFQIIAKTFLLREHSLYIQSAFLSIFSIIAVTYAAFHWFMAETVFGMALLVVTPTIMGPLITVMLHLQTKVQGELRSHAEFLTTKEKLTTKFDKLTREKDAQLSQIQNFLAAVPSQSTTMTIAEVCAHREQVGSISGDFHFFKEGPQGEINFALCDAMGHDATAGMLTLVAKSVLDSVDPASSPARWGEKIHQVVNHCGTSAFITGVLGKLWPDGKLQIVHFGHPLSFLVEAKSNTTPGQLGSGGLALGMFDLPLNSAIEEVQLHPGDTLVLWTDGFVEFSSPGDDTRSILDQFANTLRSNSDANSAANILHHAFDCFYDLVDGNEIQDDVSMVCIQYQPQNQVS